MFHDTHLKLTTMLWNKCTIPINIFNRIQSSYVHKGNRE